MPDPQSKGATARRGSHGTHVLLDRPDDVSFGFEEQRLGSAAGLSVAVHVTGAVLVFLLLRYWPAPQVAEFIPERLPDDIVWIAEEGPGGGGGGGGDNSPEPPKKVELRGKEKESVPVEVEPEPVKTPPKEEPPVQTTIPAVQTSAAPVEAPGAITAESPTSTSAGSGTGGGGGTGSGGGSGSGDGTGLGAGHTAGVGGGEYDVGNGVTAPRILRQVKPAYTSEAMRAKVQGEVLLRCVVLPDGSVGRVEIVKSLDNVFGLDQEAIKAARQWKFVPGTRLGEPVAVRVTIALDFTLR
ncbi:MAG: TonB family protein [Vicinamibacterales bacterium]